MKMIATIIAFLLIANLSYSQQRLDNQSIASTVLLEKKVDGQYVAYGTGFLLYDDGDSSSTVVTCEHILRRNSEIYVVINLDQESSIKLGQPGNSKFLQSNGGQWEIDGNSLRTRIELIEDSTYARHEVLDIAALPINIPPLISKMKGIPQSGIKKGSEVSLGTDAYFVGFAGHIGTRSKGRVADAVEEPMLRSGAIASTSEKQKTFLLDTPPFGVSSGSPLFAKGGDSSLIGMVVGDLYAAVGNTAVTVCYWMDEVLEVVDAAQL